MAVKLKGCALRLYAWISILAFLISENECVQGFWVALLAFSINAPSTAHYFFMFLFNKIIIYHGFIFLTN